MRSGSFARAAETRRRSAIASTDSEGVGVSVAILSVSNAVDTPREQAARSQSIAVFVAMRATQLANGRDLNQGPAHGRRTVPGQERSGCPLPAAVVAPIAEDQGTSAALPKARGFGDMVAAVARGEVGIVMSFELSRLARNDLDWHQLVYLCRWTMTLIADEQRLYDPSSSADRMVLGIRGQVSELERDSLVHRMVEARWNKARRGEVYYHPPAGYDLDERGQWQFDELGAARQIYLWWRDEGLPFPVRRSVPRVHPVVWVPVSYRVIHQMLRHPISAGAFAFGRSETKRELDPGTQKVVLRRGLRRARDQWPVLIKDHHPGYISFDKFLAKSGAASRQRDHGTLDG
jgi:hypothetical protein